MNWKNACFARTHPGGEIVRVYRRLSLLIALLIVGGACHHHKKAKDQTPPAGGSPVTSVLNYSCALSPAEGFAGLTGLNQATLAVEKDRLLIQAAGPDAQLGFRMTASRPFAISLDIGSPVNTVMELFYQVQNQSYSAEHALHAPLRAGRNQLLLSIDDPLFGGGVRLDPGQVAGDYSLYSLQIFSSAPVSFVRPMRPQAELAASFDASTATTLFFAKSSEDLAKIKALGGVLLIVEPRGLMARALGADPALLLPEFDLSAQPIVKIVIASPAATTLQIFYKTRDQLDYDQAHASSFPLQPGDNTIYIEIPVRNASGALRLDPGTVAGDYVLRELEARSITAGPR